MNEDVEYSHFYVYYYLEDSDIPIYDRTCGTETAAQAWVETHIGRGYDSFYTVDKIPERSWY